MKRTLGIVALLIVATAASADEPNITVGTQNGRQWAAFDAAGRLAYLQGFHDAINLVASGSRDSSSAGPASPSTFPTFAYNFYSCKCTYGEAIDAINALYASDPAYARVPIYFMIGTFAERTRGSTKEHLEKGISDFLAMLQRMETPVTKQPPN